MQISVLYFAAAAEAAECRSETISVEDGLTATDVLEELRRVHPPLADRKLFFAVNQEYREADAALNNGDELAVFTHVSGG